MKRLIKTLLFMAVLMAPLVSHGAEIKVLKHIMSVYGDDKDVAIKMPEGVACNDRSDFVVADTGNGRLIRFKFEDGKLSGGAEVKIPELTYPVRLQLNSKGEIFALDEKQRRIIRLSPGGAFAGYLEAQGVPAPDKFVPRSFKLDTNDNVYILDIAGERVLVLDPSGKFQKQIPFPKKRGFFSDLTVAANGDVFLLDSVNPAVFIAAKGSAEFTPLTKDLQEYAAFPTYITTDNRGALYLSDEHGMAIVVLGIEGSFLARRLVMGWKESQINFPAQLCVAGGNIVFIADRNNSKVQIFEVTK
jgi:hypothetical protein